MRVDVVGLTRTMRHQRDRASTQANDSKGGWCMKFKQLSLIEQWRRTSSAIL